MKLSRSTVQNAAQFQRRWRNQKKMLLNTTATITDKHHDLSLQQKWGGNTYKTVLQMSPNTPINIDEPTFEVLDLSPEEVKKATYSSHRR